MHLDVGRLVTTILAVRIHRADPGLPSRKNNTSRRRPCRARGSADRAHQPRAMQMDHANAKEMKKIVRANAVCWVPSRSSRTTLQRNQRCPRSACQQTSSLFPRERCTLA
eukprot:3119733-Pleurochrysis_carterae.AAC.1